MCRPRRRIRRRLGLLALLAGLVASPVAGQDAPVQAVDVQGLTRAELVERLVEENARAREMIARQKAMKASAIERGLDAARSRSETVRVGPVTLVGEPDLLDGVAAGVQRGLDQHRAILGPLDHLREITFAVFFADDPAMGTLGGEDASPIRLHRGGLWNDANPFRLGRTEAERIVRESVSEQLLFNWSRGMGWSWPTPKSTVVSQLLGSRRETVLACVQQADLAACRTALFTEWDGTDETALPLVLEARPDLVDYHESVAARRHSRGTTIPCASSDVSSLSCLLSYTGGGGTVVGVIPMASSARGDLVAHALDIGGPEALSRMLAAPDGQTVGQLLEITADVPLDELLASWVSEFGNLPNPRRTSGTTLLWAGLFLLFSLGSTRWRLG